MSCNQPKGESDMLKYLLKRMAQAVPLLLLITMLCFFLIDLAP